VIKRALSKRLPTADSIRSSWWLRWLAPWVGHPRLWHLHRRGVALGVAIGLVTGLIPGPVQMLLAALIAIPLRANLPAAVFTTLYTNPITFVPLYGLAFGIGRWITGDTTPMRLPAESIFEWSAPAESVLALFRWMASLGDTLLIGLLVQCVSFAVGGYLVTLVLWRCAVGWAWTRRSARRATVTR
jgi:hypothetical protein